jgi:type III secretion protein L
MAFIKLSDLPPSPTLRVAPGSPVLKAQDHAAWLQAQQLLEEARQEALALVSQAQAELEAHRQRGFEQGMQEALLEQSERMIENATRMVEFFSSVEQRMVGLVMAAVRKIIMDFDDTERVVAVVTSGLAVMRNQKQLTLRLPPEHVEAVRVRATQLLERFPGIGMLDFVGDSRLKGDAAILESEIGVVEASIEQQLKAIEAGFHKMLGSRV